MGGAEIAPVVTAIAAHTATPPRNTQTRAVPRSRIVARSARYCSCSLGVTIRSSALAGVASGADTWSMVREVRLGHSELIRHDNSLAVYELSARISLADQLGTTLKQGRYA